MPPTPLIPAEIRNALGAQQAPDVLCALACKSLVVRDLGAEVWDQIHAVDQQSLRSLVDLVQSQLQDIWHVDLSFVAGGEPLTIDALPLSTQTQNALRPIFGDRPLPARAVIRDLLKIPDLGVRSLVELACVVEAAQACGFSNYAASSRPNRLKNTLPSEIGSFFTLLGAWAAGEQGLKQISSALPISHPDWPEELREHWTRLGSISADDLGGEKIQRYNVVTLMSSWVGSLDERLTDILETRLLATCNPDTLEQLGTRHGVTRERIRQVERKAKRHLERLQESQYDPVLRRAARLRERLGTALLENDPELVDALNWVVADFKPCSMQTLMRRLFLWLAGPYEKLNGWLVADSDIVSKTKQALFRYETDRAMIPEDVIRNILNDLGIRETCHSAWIDSLKEFRRVDNGLLHLTGTIADKAAQYLAIVRRPITADELAGLIGASSLRSVRQRLMSDSRFWRINRQNQFVLAGTEGYDEYTGITDEIIQELEACGGSATVKHLVETIAKTYGVKPASVLAYLSTPLFVRDDSDLIRLRHDEEVTIATDMSKTAGCYRVGDKWAWRTKVDRQLLRGSGRSFPNAFARELGCDLGDKVEVNSTFGHITISWPSSSISGAAIGSIRSALEGLSASEGDYVFIIADGRQIDFQMLRQEQLQAEDTVVRLAGLVGVTDIESSKNLLPKIAAALGVDHQQLDGPLEQEIRDVLLGRGEEDLGVLIELPKLSIEQYLDRIGAALGHSN